MSVSEAVAVGGAETPSSGPPTATARWEEEKVSDLAVSVSARLFLQDRHVCFNVHFWGNTGGETASPSTRRAILKAIGKQDREINQ